MGSSRIETAVPIGPVSLEVNLGGGVDEGTNDPQITALNQEFVTRVIGQMKKYVKATGNGNGEGLKLFVATSLVLNNYFGGNRNNQLFDEFEGSIGGGISHLAVDSAVDFLIHNVMGIDVIYENPFSAPIFATEEQFESRAIQMLMMGMMREAMEQQLSQGPDPFDIEEDTASRHFETPPLINSGCLRDVNGTDISPRQWIGKPTVIYHFATWCPHCEKYLYIADNIAKRYGDKINIIILAGEDSDKIDVKEYAQKKPYAIFIYDNVEVLKPFKKDISGVPFMMIYNRKGEPISLSHPADSIVPAVIDSALKDDPVETPESVRCLRGPRTDM